jgi:L-cysteine desulfidase
MINILTNKLSESKDNNIVWKNNNPVLYQKYCQYIQKEENVQKKCNLVPKVLNVIPVSVDRTNKVELVNATIPAVRVHDIIPVDIVNPNIPVDKSRDSILEDRNRVVPVELEIANIPVDKMRAVADNRVSTNKPIKSNKVKKNINSPMKIILEESLTYDTFRDDVREKIINLVSSKEFNKVFGITKSAEIMSGIANDRFNKSTVLFISFLFDKCVIYNNKNVIYEKNNGTITIS